MQDRVKNAVATLAVGLALNIGLGVAKLVAGMLCGSVSVTSDALNNISDAAVSVVTIIATALAARKADREHPFGHGRYEYIAAFVVAAGILAVGAEVAINGVRRIITPETVRYDLAMWITLGIAVAIKGMMSVMYFVRAKKVRSETLAAAAVDSVSDVAVTTAVLCCALAERYTGAHIDGYASVAVSAVILLFAVRMLRSTVSRLVGERPSAELYREVKDIICASPEVLSVHDIVINDYGEANKIAEADAVFPADMTFVAVHAACDAIERAVRERTGIKLSLHADPSAEKDARLELMERRVSEAIAPFGATAHDISFDENAERVELDILLEADGAPESEITAAAKAAVLTVEDCEVVVNIDYF